MDREWALGVCTGSTHAAAAAAHAGAPLTSVTRRIACHADCCDGTDELSGCSNTCVEKNAAVREALKAKVAEYKQALDIKEAYKEQAEDLRATLQQRGNVIDAEIAAKAQEVDALQGEPGGGG